MTEHYPTEPPETFEEMLRRTNRGMNEAVQAYRDALLITSATMTSTQMGRVVNRRRQAIDSNLRVARAAEHVGDRNRARLAKKPTKGQAVPADECDTDPIRGVDVAWTYHLPTPVWISPSGGRRMVRAMMDATPPTEYLVTFGPFAATITFPEGNVLYFRADSEQVGGDLLDVARLLASYADRCLVLAANESGSSREEHIRAKAEELTANPPSWEELRDWADLMARSIQAEGFGEDYAWPYLMRLLFDVLGPVNGFGDWLRLCQAQPDAHPLELAHAVAASHT